MREVPLAELCEINIGRTPARAEPSYWGPGHKWLSIADMSQGLAIHKTKEQITEAGARLGRIVEPGTVLLSFKLSIGKIGIAEVPLFTNEAIAALPIKDERRLNPRYLMRALEAMDLAGSANRAAMGATLNKKSLAQILVPLPPLHEQLRIATILDLADTLRTSRRQTANRLRSLIQSTFASIFGNMRESRWTEVRFQELVPKIDSGTSPNCEPRPANLNEWGVLKLGAVTYGTFQPHQNKAYLGDAAALERNEVREGDVLMTRKNTRELVGAVALVGEVRRRLLIPDLVFRLHLDAERIDRRYFQALMMSSRKRSLVRGLSSGTASSMPNISKRRLADLPLELPPLSLQQDFAFRVESIERQHTIVQSASRTDEALFESLQRRAFRGGL